MSIKEEFEALQARKVDTPIEDRLQVMIDAMEAGATNGWNRTSYGIYEEVIPSKLTEGRDRLWAHLLEQKAEATKSPEDKAILNTIAAITRRKIGVKANPALMMVFTAAECLCIAAYLTKDKSLKTAVLNKAKTIIGFPTRVSEQTAEPLIDCEINNPNKRVVEMFGNDLAKYQEALFSIQKTVNGLNETFKEIAATNDINKKEKTYTALFETIKDIYHQRDPVSQNLFDIVLEILAKQVPLEETSDIEDDDYEEIEGNYNEIFEEE